MRTAARPATARAETPRPAATAPAGRTVHGTRSRISVPGPLSFLSRLFGGRPPRLSPAAFVAGRDPDAPLLDVRTAAECAGGGLRGAVNVDVSAAGFRERVARLGLPADAPVYVYCASGMRSGRAVGILRAMGHAGAVDVGGLGALRAAGAR